MLSSGDKMRLAMERVGERYPDVPPVDLIEAMDVLVGNPDVVDIETFIYDENYANAPKGSIYPEVMVALKELNRRGRYVEAVLTGSIGAAKTTIALWTQLYQLYCLAEMDDPHGEFDIQPTDEIVIVFQSLKLKSAKDVDYDRFKALVDRAPYFQREFRYDPNIKSQLNFPKRIRVKPIAGVETGAIGENVIGGIIDEINFMAHVEGSKMSPDSTVYDQAVSLYQAIARRRESRFMDQGELAGMLCLVSSKRYRGQFTDRKEVEAATNPAIFLYDKRVWDVKPWAFSGKTFDVFVGDETRKPYIVDHLGDVHEEDRRLVEAIPIEYLKQFEVDLLDSLRDIAGVSTTAIHPFIMEPHKVVACFGAHLSIFERDAVDFVATKLRILPKRFVRPDEPRYVHLDLAITSDSAGFAIGFVRGFRSIERSPGVYEFAPEVHIDGILEIPPPRGGEIQFDKVRAVIYKLREMGLNVTWVSADSFQSTDTLQELHREGFVVGQLSMDTKTRPYDIAKQALYDGRVFAPEHPKCQQEILRLERDVKKGKIDHPTSGSKDCADAVCGVIYGVSMRREVWVRHNVDPRKMPMTMRSPEDRDG